MNSLARRDMVGMAMTIQDRDVAYRGPWEKLCYVFAVYNSIDLSFFKYSPGFTDGYKDTVKEHLG